MSRQRQQHKPEFKVKVALEALRENAADHPKKLAYQKNTDIADECTIPSPLSLGSIIKGVEEQAISG